MENNVYKLLDNLKFKKNVYNNYAQNIADSSEVCADTQCLVNLV